jgi:hypothetical protein
MKNNISNVTLLLSAVIFLFASAFTLNPNLDTSVSEESLIEMEMIGGCDTCTFDSSGAPNGCTSASFCGMTTCEGSCELGGTLCGECACEDPTVPCEG